MKKYLALLLCVTLFFAAGCKKPAGEDEWAETPTSTVMPGTVLSIEGGAMLVEPDKAAWERASSDRFSIPLEKMEASPEPRVGDRVEVCYAGSIHEIYPATLGNILWVRVAEKTSEKGCAVSVDGTLYHNTGYAVPAEPDGSVIRYIELPAGAAEPPVSAYAVLERGTLLLGLIDGEWYEFRPEREDGTVRSIETVLSVASLDIDSDGVREVCTLTYGPTSGLFTVQIIASVDDGAVKYRNLFYMDCGDVALAEKDGKAQFVFNGEYHALSVRDGAIVIEDIPNALLEVPQGDGQ